MVNAIFRGPIQNAANHSSSHQREILEPLPGFGQGLTVPGVARTDIAYAQANGGKAYQL